MIDFDQYQNTAYIQIKGSPSIDEMQQKVHALLDHPEYQDGMDEIWDVSRACLAHWKEDDMREQVRFAKKAVPEVVGQIAFIVGNDLNFGMVRMWMTYVEQSASEGRRNVFKSLDAAAQWLQQKPVVQLNGKT